MRLRRILRTKLPFFRNRLLQYMRKKAKSPQKHKKRKQYVPYIILLSSVN